MGSSLDFLRSSLITFIGAKACADEEGMIHDSLDLSYLGVLALWQHDLGKDIHTVACVDETMANCGCLKALIRKHE